MINAPQFPSYQASILNQTKRRKVQPGRAVEDDEAPHSGATGEHMQRFFDALDNADEHELRHALGKVVETWRADNAAGGLAVYAHAPLPNIFADAVVHAMRSAPDTAGRALAEGITANLEPGTRNAVLKQLGEVMNAQALDVARSARKADAPPVGATGHMVEGEQSNNINALFKSLLKHEEVAMPEGDTTAQSNRIVELKSLFEQARKGFNADPESVDDPRRATTLEYRPDRDGPQRAETLPWDGQRREATPLQNAPAHDSWWKNKPLIPEEGGEAGFDPTPKSGPFARPQVDPLDTPPPGYEYEAWRKAPNPRTETGSLLVSPSRLTERQRRNLDDRTWIRPTSKSVGAGRLEKGRGYFGADRDGIGPPRHGGYDAPYKFPWEGDVDENGKPRSREVRLPTRVLSAEFAPNDSSGRLINRLSFDLGDGIKLELLHVEPTPALLKAIRDAQRTGRPLQIDAGVLLGNIDTNHDHTHVQIIVTQPNGDRWTVDPTYYMEKKARSFSREPMRDDWEWWIDRGIDGYNWAQRQLE